MISIKADKPVYLRNALTQFLYKFMKSFLLQAFFLKNFKKSVRVINYIFTGVLIFSFMFHQNFRDQAKLAADVSVIVFLIVITPGMLKRFRVKGILQHLQILLMTGRRELGILTYLLTFFHFSWMWLIPTMNSGSLEFPLLFELFGLAAFLLLTPLFLTSHNFFVRKLGKNWIRLHAMIYLILWLIFAHTVLVNHMIFSAMLGIFGILEVASFMNAFFIKSRPDS